MLGQRAGRRRVGTAVLIGAVLFAASGGPNATPAAAHGDSYLWWDEGGSEFKTVTGPSQPVTIHQGQIDFLCDAFYPTADVYIVFLAPAIGGALHDVSGRSYGSPNTVFGASGGVFIEETIAFTAPTGTLWEGWYDIVYDECQDGFLGPEDSVFLDALYVDLPTDLGPLDTAIDDLKHDALHQYYDWRSRAEDIDRLERLKQMKMLLDCLNGGAGGCAARLAADLAMKQYVALIREATGAIDPKKAAKDLALDVASRYDGIAADPPDPAFDKVAVPAVPPSPLPETDDPLDAALLHLAAEGAVEGSVAEALLHAIERYQGADASSDGSGGFAQASQMRSLADSLAEQLARTDDALASLASAIAANADDLDDVASFAAPELERIADEGFSPEQVRELRNAGLSSDGIAELEASIANEPGLTGFGTADLLASLATHRAGAAALSATLSTLSADLDVMIADIAASPGVAPGVPTADAGGPYTTGEGLPLSLDGSQSEDPDGLPVALEWDLDADGAFDDAIGPSPSVALAGAGTHVVSIRATDVDGLTDVDSAWVIVANTRHRPEIDAASPEGERPQLLVGGSQSFAVTASDPDGDPVTTSWLVDGVAAGTGSTHAFGPAAAGDVGFRWVRANVSDGDAAGGVTSRDWILQVRAADGDADGWNANADCDDADAAVNPGQAEILLNNKDDDCNPATSDDGQAPSAAFVSSAPAGGRNVALFDSSPFDPNASSIGAIPVASSPVFDGAHTMAKALDIGTEDIAWAANPAALRYGVVRLWGNQAWLIDRIAIMPRIDVPGQRVKDFAVDVSTTGFANESDWANVLTATAADNANLQTFVLPGGAVMAKYVRVRLFTNRGDPNYIAVEQFKVYTPQQSGGSTFDFQDRSTDPENDIVARLWSFGDGTTSTATNPSHTYASAGNKTVTLTVTDSRGHQSSTSLVHRVLTPPTGSFAQPATTTENGTLVCNCGYTAGDADGERIVRLELNWGDGSPIQLQTNPNSLPHVYAADGVYTITFTVVDAQEQRTPVQRTVTVLNVAPSVTLVSRTVLDGLPYDYTVTASDPADPIVCTWEWGDGSPNTTGCGTQAHTYPSMAAGAPDAAYTQTVRVADDDVTVTRTAAITVKAFEPEPFDFDVFYSRWRGGSSTNTNVKKVRVSYADSSGLTLGTKTNIAWTAGADGIIFAPDGDLIVGGQSNSIYKINPTTGVIQTRNAGAGSLHVMLDPSGTKVWTSWIPGTPAEVPLNPFTNGTARPLTGTDTQITSIAWTPSGAAYYTSSGSGGVGSFGRINLTTFQTTRLFSNLAAAHGMVYDPYTGWFVLFGNTWITQVDPATETIVASRNFGIGFDQGAVDGKGRLFVASGSDMFFVDYSRTGRIDDPANYTFRGFLDPDIDDFAPLVGLGGQPPVALGQSVSTSENASVAIALGATGLVTSWEIVDAPDHGTLSGSAPGLTYTPEPGYHGGDTFTFRVLNGITASNTATVSITIVADDEPPVADAGGPYIVEEGSTVLLDASGSHDPDGESLGYAWDLDGDGEYDDAVGASASYVGLDGPATITVGVQITAGGVSRTDTATVTVSNLAPTAILTSPVAVAEGSAFTVSLDSAADPSAADATGLEFAFDCGFGLGLGTFGIASSATCTAGDDTVDAAVKARVRDDDGGITEYGVAVDVTNVAPSATLSLPISVGEAGTFSLSLIDASDPSSADAGAGFEFAFDCDGSGFGGWSPTAATSCPALPDDGTQQVRGKIRDKDGGERPYTASLAVLNLGPNVSLANDGPSAWGLPISFSASATDPSPVDMAALTFEWDFDGDGTFEAGPFGSPTRAQAYGSPGTFVAGVRVCDGDACASATTSVTVDRRDTALADETTATVQYSDQLTVQARLTDGTVAGPVTGRSVTLSAGAASGSDTTSSTGRASFQVTVGAPAGPLATHAGFAGDTHYGASSVDGEVAVTAEDASLEYGGDTFTTGTSARLAATVQEVADGSLGSITRAYVTFDVYAGAAACGSGTPTRLGPVAVVDTGTQGDGIGTAEVSMATPAEQTYCIVARLTGAGQQTANPYYAAVPAQNAVLTVVSTTGKFATGGGWIVDPETGGHGNFGFTARFTKPGQPKGQAVYVWRTTYAGQLVDVIVKSTSITGLTFADQLGNGTFPWRVTMTGKATIRISRASSGTELWSDGNASFTLVAIDSSESSGRGADSFAIRVVDKNGNVYHLVGGWSGVAWNSGILLSGGNVMVHLK